MTVQESIALLRKYLEIKESQGEWLLNDLSLGQALRIVLRLVESVIDKPNPAHPIQPLITDEHGTIRFKEKSIIPFSVEDREQFAQLIGYSLDGFSELSYVTDETYNRACAEMPDTKEGKVTKEQSAALRRWNASCEEREAIESFLNWLEHQSGFSWRSTIPLRDLIDKYYGINRQDLESGRKAIIQDAIDKGE